MRVDSFLGRFYVVIFFSLSLFSCESRERLPQKMVGVHIGQSTQSLPRVAQKIFSREGNMALVLRLKGTV